MLELIIAPVLFVVFVLYLICSIYIEQKKYYRYHHPTEKDMNISSDSSDSEHEEEINEEEINEEEEINDEEERVLN